MNLHDHQDKYKRIDDLIRRKATGTLSQLALKLGKSKRSMSRYLQEFKEECEAPFAYDRRERTYCYTEHFELKIEATYTVNGEKKKI
jgi:hypothetical protein